MLRRGGTGPGGPARVAARSPDPPPPVAPSWAPSGLADYAKLGRVPAAGLAHVYGASDRDIAGFWHELSK